MAITVGTGTSAYSEGTTVTVNKPSGVSDGDLLVAVICSDTGYFADVAAPAGWTLVTAASIDQGAFTAGNLKTFTRIVSGDGASYAFDHYDGAATAITIVPIFGAGATPTLAWAIDDTGTTETAPSVTASAASDGLVCWVFIPHGASSTPNYSPPSGMTEVADTASTGWASMAAAKLTPVGSAGATGTKDFSVASITKGTPEVTVSLAIADPGGGATDYTKTPADSAGITDVPTVVQAQTRTPSDAVGATDSATTAQGFDRTQPDTLGITDSVAADFTGSVSRTQDDAVGLTDAVAVALTVDRAPADTLGITDTDSPLVLEVTEVVDDPVGLTDSVTIVRTVAATAADALGITDSAAAAGEGDSTASPADDVPLSDAAAGVLDSIRTPADLLALADSVASSSTAVRGPTDVAPISDSVVAVMERVVTVADSLAVVDAAAHFTGVVSTPAIRTIAIPAETRVVVIPAENRTLEA